MSEPISPSPVRLGVVFGSRSVEHEVSIITAAQLMKHVDTARFEVVPLYIDKLGRWWSGPSLSKVETYQNQDLTNPDFKDGYPVHFLPDPTVDHGVDVVINCVHGTHGEDGTLAGLFELANVPYVAPDVVAAGIAIDKLVTKHVLQSVGVPVLPSIAVTAKDWKENAAEIRSQAEKLSETGVVFVKPHRLGSSVGVTRVKSKDKLGEALELVFALDTTALIEPEAPDCIEVNISVIGSAENPRVSSTEQPIQSDEFLSYADKYERGGKKSSGMAGLTRRIPAPVAPSTIAKVEDFAKKAWKAIGGSGVARLDFFVNPTTEDVYLNEINSPPGSMAFYLWEASGLPYRELITTLVETAIERAQQKEQLMQSIQTNILSQQKG